MKKKFILLAMMLLTIIGGAKFNVLNAQETITIGSGNEYNNGYVYSPLPTNYNYSLTQHIYTSAEMNDGTPGTISSITLYTYNVYDVNRKVEIYLMNTDKSSFSSTTDWVNMTEANLVYDFNSLNGSDTDIPTSGIWTIDINDFEYTGGNLLLCINDKTGLCPNYSPSVLTNYSTNSNRTVKAMNDNHGQYDLSNITVSTSSNLGLVTYNPKISFTIEAAAANLEVSETSIALGNVRMGKNFFTEKPFSPKDVEVKVTSTTVTNVTCDNNFFTIELPAEVDYSKTFTFKVGYNKEANVTEPQNGTITIAWQDGEAKTISVSATPYTATAPDAIEAFTTVTFDGNNAFISTPTFGNLHDDYILPGEDEATNGNAPDAVYKFELTEDATISASITGNDITNSYLAIYNAETMGDGPSSNNNDQGVQSGPQGPTTFFYDFNDRDLSYFNLIDVDGDGKNWSCTSNYNAALQYIISYSWGSNAINTDNYIVTKEQYNITATSKLTYKCYNGEWDNYGIYVSDDGINFDLVFEETPSEVSNWLDREVSLENHTGLKYIAIRHNTYGKYYVCIDDLALTDGSSKSRAAGLATIDGVQYPAGTYYLVAAADNAFTVNLSTASVPAPADFALTAPEDNATEQNNPELTWETAQYASSYNVYLGTSEDLTNVEPKTVTTNSYQTEGLQNNTKYYWTVEAVNAQGTTATTSETWSFVTTLDVPQNVTVTSENHIAGGDITLKWDEIEGAKYNVYVGDICHNGTTPITATEYTISNVDYSKEGWNITVTAVYEGLGESEKSETVNVKVTGYGHILVNVNGGISNVNYTINGADEFGNAVEEIIGTTDNVGMATVSVLAGTYTVTVSKFDYKDATMENVVVNYGAQTEATLTMTQKPAASFAVTAVDNVTTANVSWTTDEYTTFNVYRRNVQTDEVEKIASNVYYKQYQDAAWNEFTAGEEYEYGVSTYVGEDAVLMNEGFEHGGTFPAGWNTQQPNYTYYWQLISNFIFINSNYHYPYEGSYGMVMKGNGGYEYTSGNYLYLITPEIDLSNYMLPSLSFYYRNYTTYSYANRLYIKVKTETSGWEDVITISDATTNYEKTTVTDALQKYSGQKIQIAFVVQRYGGQATFLDNVVVTAKQQVESAINWASPITKEEWVAFDGTEDNTWSEKNVLVAADRTINGEVTVNKLSINGGTLTVAKDAKLTVNGKLNNATSANFVIEDGAQVFQSSADVKATFNMGIINPSEWSKENKEGWNFVSSPFTAAGLSQFTFDLSGKGLDLYRYNGAEEGAEWRHYNVGNAEFASNNFDLGYGYMLAHETKETVSLYGTLNNASEHTWEVSYTENAVNGDLANFHLVGNPFSFDMDMNKLAQTNMVTGYAVLNAEGNAYTYATEGTVKVGDAFFVKTTAAEPTMSYNHFVRATRGEKASSLNIIATSAEGSDNVIVNLAGAEKEGFNKLQNFNEAIATVYVQHEDKNYGIFNCNEDVQEIELCFNANQMGNYTISIEPNGKFQSVTLVDRFTGIETNMLLEDYHFTAMSNVNNNRFIVKLVNGQQTTDNSHFAYVMGEELIVEVEGSVQIIDVMGRVIYANDVTSDNNRINVSAFDNAAYVIRVVNENGVKVQKIIL